ncbi:hypothetical protein IWZ00DRAFT_510687 [Phyllosticta capitalensis]|uniref:uncharacterized protein n=1 Tax=Phyllosticta capitalensis TaxID=121624 RepID=UPI0031326C3B
MLRLLRRPLSLVVLLPYRYVGSPTEMTIGLLKLFYLASWRHAWPMSLPFIAAATPIADGEVKATRKIPCARLIGQNGSWGWLVGQFDSRSPGTCPT